MSENRERESKHTAAAQHKYLVNVIKCAFLSVI